MASGLPDYFKAIRPRYGAANSEIAVVQVVAKEETELVSVVGKGVIYGGALHLALASGQKNSVPVLEVDEANIAELNFFTMNFYHMNIVGCYPFYLLTFDDVSGIYAVGISGGITFEKGVRVLYQEEHDTRPWVVCRAIYALI